MVLKIFKTIRNNWKKSVFFTGLSIYGLKYCKELYRDSLIRYEYCNEAKKYGQQPLYQNGRPRKVTVFLNPAAQKGKAKKIFEKNVAPILYLAGLEVTVVKTEYEGQAKKYMDVIDSSTDAIIVAGGDGTLCEVITGLLRRPDVDTIEKIPIGVIPLGFTNSLAKSLAVKGESTVQWMAELGMSIIKSTTKKIDVMCIESEEGKNVYAVNALHWGPYQDAEKRKYKYWYLGGLKHRWTYLMSVLGDWPPNVQADLNYEFPCEGCSNCYVPPPPIQWKWWHFFLPPKVSIPIKDYSAIENPECGQKHEIKVNAIEFQAHTKNTLTSQDNSQEEASSLKLNIGPSDISKTDFIREGWSRIRNFKSEDNDKIVNAGTFTLSPHATKDEEAWFSIDNEQFETMKIKVTVLKDKLNIFCPPSNHKS